MLQTQNMPGLQYFCKGANASLVQATVTKRLQKVYRTATCENRAVVLIYVSER